MYYVFADSGEFICDYEKVEEALGRQSRMSEPTLVLYSDSPNCQDAWEHGIEVMAPASKEHKFVYKLKLENSFVLETFASGFEHALESIKWDLTRNPGADLLSLEERITITHKVKL